MKSKQTRPYQMSARAEATANTHRLIIEAAFRLFGGRLFDEVSLEDIARDAGVTVQTVLRRFNSKQGLVEATIALGLAEVRRARWSPPAGDINAAMKALVQHYEEWGARSIRFLAQEERVPAMKQITDAGRALHYEWVEHVFESWLNKSAGIDRERLRARLIASTDVYVWKIMRLDLGLDAGATEATMRGMVLAILA